jgi:DNA invertase Pin-like site-specific DNA recombinase
MTITGARHFWQLIGNAWGRSGLGLEAQRQAVGEHLNGGNWKLVAEFTEVESGKRSDRPRLAEALKACRLQGAKLIIAKLDRLARNVAFISNLMESKVEFEAVDFPQANRLTIHIMGAIAEHEAKMISDLTRAALAAAKDGASG